MTDRTAKLLDFINKSGWGHAKCSPLAADASTRSYDRLTDPATGETRVVMIDPPASGSSIPTFLQVSDILHNGGFSAPIIYNRDIENGFLLIEDLGENLFARLCNNNAALEQELYATAIDVLLNLHRQPLPDNIPPYDLAVYQRETDLLTDWYLPAATQSPTTPAILARFRTIVRQACEQLPTDRNVLVLRDYHAENLLWLPERSDIMQVGLLDYQDALIGHPAYDLVSLLEDARRDTSPELRTRMLQRYIQGSAIDAERFTQAYHILGAQRNIKIIGIFARLFVRDSKAKYLDLIARVWDHLQHDLTHPVLNDLRLWINENVPPPDYTTLGNIRKAANVA